MEANVKMVWLVIECPHCHAPQVVNKYIHKNKIYDPFRKMVKTCQFCDKEYYVHLVDKDPPKESASGVGVADQPQEATKIVYNLS